ncbi:hypothetical protein BDY24DRAFT_401024 [Mrakia frigida]|uniref:uncharacterized protein n=1 Tax=Mrakia frigida TaxID=29902 RepID=UPI003FCC086E
MANVFPLSFPPRPSNPSPFGFGFGGGVTSTTPSSFGSPLRRPPQLLQPTTPSSSFGRPYQPPSPSVFGAASAYGTSAPSPSKRKSPSTSTSTNSTKRRGRESDEDDEEEEEDSDMGGHAGGGERQIAGRVIVRRGGKKSRLQTEQHEPPTSSKQLDSPSKAQQDDGVDVGVLLALLPSTSLLPILTSLVTLHPELKSSLLSLIPTPSLSSALEALRLADEKIRVAVPFGWPPGNAPSSSSRSSIFGGGGGVSENYVLGRIQGPVGELASLIQSHLPYFTTTPTLHHPTTTFPYLQAITTLLLRLSSTLPSPLTSLDILWPRIAEEWLRWIASVDQLVNKSGGMVGAGVADAWIRELDSLASRGGGGKTGGGVLEGRMKNEMGVVRDRWVQQVGWLVNRRVGEMPPGHGHGGGDVGMGMEEEEL